MEISSKHEQIANSLYMRGAGRKIPAGRTTDGSSRNGGRLSAVFRHGK
jgi:hypothetical protein